MTKDKVTQAEANKRWEENNKERANYLKSRTAARSFIRRKATIDDFEEIASLANERKLIKTVKYDKDKIDKLEKLVKENSNYKDYSYAQQKELFEDLQDLINYTVDKRTEVFSQQTNSNIVVTLNPIIEIRISKAIEFQGKLLDVMLSNNN